MQFTAAEQAQLMRWLEELVSQGEIEVDAAHPLSAAFEALTKYVGRHGDDLPSLSM